MIEEIGTVTATKGRSIWVSTEIKSTCGSCHVQSDCGTGVIARAFAPKKQQLVLECEENVAVGQQVRLGIPEEQLLSASFVVYIIPVVALIGGAIFGQWLLPFLDLNSEIWTVAFSFLCAWLAFRFVRFYVNSREQAQYQPKLLGVLPLQSEQIAVKVIEPEH